MKRISSPLEQEFVTAEHFGYDRLQGHVRAHHGLPVDPLGRELVGNFIPGAPAGEDFCPGELFQDGSQAPVVIRVAVGDENMGQLPAGTPDHVRNLPGVRWFPLRVYQDGLFFPQYDDRFFTDTTVFRIIGKYLQRRRESTAWRTPIKEGRIKFRC